MTRLPPWIVRGIFAYGCLATVGSVVLEIWVLQGGGLPETPLPWVVALGFQYVPMYAMCRPSLFMWRPLFRPTWVRLWVATDGEAIFLSSWVIAAVGLLTSVIIVSGGAFAWSTLFGRDAGLDERTD